MQANQVKEMAGRASVPVLQPARTRSPDAVASIRGLGPDLLVVASYGQILPRSLLSLGCRAPLNLHPSLLPTLRGPSPIASAILQGLETTGVSLMVMTERMDAGPIIAQQTLPILPAETEGQLRTRLADLSATILMEYLAAYVSGTTDIRPQNEDLATYTRKIGKEDGVIDWNVGADIIAREIRAFNPWPAARSHYEGLPVRFLMAEAVPGSALAGHVTDITAEGMFVGTGRGLLRVTLMQLPGGRPLPPDALARGRPSLARAVFKDTA